MDIISIFLKGGKLCYFEQWVYYRTWDNLTFQFLETTAGCWLPWKQWWWESDNLSVIIGKNKKIGYIVNDYYLKMQSHRHFSWGGKYRTFYSPSCSFFQFQSFAEAFASVQRAMDRYQIPRLAFVWIPALNEIFIKILQ